MQWIFSIIVALLVIVLGTASVLLQLERHEEQTRVADRQWRKAS